MSGILTELSQAGTALFLLEYQMNYSFSLKFRVWYAEEKYFQLLLFISYQFRSCQLPVPSKQQGLEEYSEEPDPPWSLIVCVKRETTVYDPHCELNACQLYALC